MTTRCSAGGGLVADLASRGTEVHVLFLTDGRGGTAAESADEIEVHVARRRAEADGACEVLGVSSSSDLGLPDGALHQRQDELSGRFARGDLASSALISCWYRRRSKPLQTIAPPSPRLTVYWRLCERAMISSTSSGTCGSLLWEANRLLYPDVAGRRRRPHRVPSKDAMACYESQEALHPYLRAALGIRRYRAFTSRARRRSGGEAYRSLTLDDLRTRGLDSLVRHLGWHVGIAGGGRRSFGVRRRPHQGSTAAVEGRR